MAAKNHSLNLFYHIKIAIASWNCDVEIPRFHEYTININLIGDFSFQKSVCIIKSICSNTNNINNKHEGWNFINLIDLILNKCTNYTNLFINVWNERETIRFINFIVLFIRRKSNFVSRVTCLSLDNNFESSTLFALFPDFPTCPIVPIIYGFTHKLKGTSNYTPFYPARGTVDTLGCTWNATSVFTKLNCVALKILHL